MRKVFQNRWEIVLGVVVAFMVLTGLNVVISQITINTSPLSVEVPDFALPINRSNDASLRPFSELDLPETFARPVFSPIRREFVDPSPPPVEIARAEPEPVRTVSLSPPLIKLLGTRVIEGRRAVLIDQKEKDALWLGEGDTIDGWKIHSIASDSISLRSGDQNIVVLLYD